MTCVIPLNRQTMGYITGVSAVVSGGPQQPQELFEGNFMSRTLMRSIVAGGAVLALAAGCASTDDSGSSSGDGPSAAGLTIGTTDKVTLGGFFYGDNPTSYYNPIQQFNYTIGKNATDMAMVIDAMDILYSGKVDGFCLVSSDSDFTRLAARLRESGMTVIGMGESKTPTAFKSACVTFHAIVQLWLAPSRIHHVFCSWMSL